MTPAPDYIVPFAGGLADVLCLFEPGVVPPVSWMGGKRRLAPVILAALGLRPGQGARRVVAVDAGPWGWVWPAILDPEMSAAVCRVLRGWADRDIRVLWFELRDEGPRGDPAEAVAQWLVLQARSANGAPVFWAEDGRALQGSGEGRRPQPAGQRNPQRSDPRLLQGDRRPGRYYPAWQNKVPRLMASDGRGVVREAGAKGDKPTLRRGHDDGGDRPADQKGKNAAGCGGLVRIETLAERVEAIGRAPWASRIEVIHGRAEDLPALLPRDLRGSAVYLDPPYRGCTGYGWDVERAALVAMAREYARRGAWVAVSEATGLASDLGLGWEEQDVTIGKKAEWLTTWRGERPPVRAVQLTLPLFAAGAP